MEHERITLKNIMSQHKSHRSVSGDGYLTGKLLVAMPFLQEAQFVHSVIYVCGHDDQGAIGLIINKHIPNLTFKDLITQLHLNVDLDDYVPNFDVHYGGPIEVTRGFVLHSADYKIDSTVMLSGKICITSTLEILRALAANRGPENFLVCLGYTGWAAGQLETEIQENDWMIVDASQDLIFNTVLDHKWRNSMAAIGVDPTTLSIESGHA